MFVKPPGTNSYTRYTGSLHNTQHFTLWNKRTPTQQSKTTAEVFPERLPEHNLLFFSFLGNEADLEAG